MNPKKKATTSAALSLPEKTTGRKTTDSRHGRSASSTRRLYSEAISYLYNAEAKEIDRLVEISKRVGEGKK